MAGNSTSSQSSGVTGGDGDLSSFVHQHHISNLELLDKEAMSSEWTDEKHSLYLKSIETSFVQQLYSSMESSGLYSHKKHSLHTRSSEGNKSRATDQRFKFGKGEPPPQKAGKSRILQNSWIQHFRSRDNPPIEGSASYGNEQMSFGGRAIYAHALANISDNFHICPTIGDSSFGEGFSGQNFDDEEENEERTCSLHTTKRMKTAEPLTKNHE